MNCIIIYTAKNELIEVSGRTHFILCISIWKSDLIDFHSVNQRLDKKKRNHFE